MNDVRNYMEILVQEHLDEVLRAQQICKCDKCKKDIYAISLNSLKPMYAVTDKGMVMNKVNMLKQQCQADVIAAITTAAGKVAKEPRHEA